MSSTFEARKNHLGGQWWHFSLSSNILNCIAYLIHLDISLSVRPQGLKPRRTWKGTKFLSVVKSAYATIKTQDWMKMSFTRDGFGYLTYVNPIQIQPIYIWSETILDLIWVWASRIYSISKNIHIVYKFGVIRSISDSKKWYFINLYFENI